MSAWRARLSAGLLHPACKPAVGLLLMAPLAALIWGVVQDSLGANPAETLIRNSGEMTLRCLLLTLAVTPLREWTGVAAFARLRRMLGLLTFTWALLHLLAYAWLDMGLYVDDILRDVAKRPFILVGTLAVLLMLPLALTSFNAAIKALGASRWKRLHRAVYAVGLLAILHFFWMRAGKQNFGDVAVYGAILLPLLGWRLKGLQRHWTRQRA
ncbi:MAG: sulfoxide reductase heme-binding subunit YedZ [Betaproteobacteria bacterium]|nr:sulfoxide reductase heme-binding subunit YedZ [Betaproteobacteria bacterium]